VLVADISSAIAISAGFNHACALLSNATIQCWGYNFYGNLGNGTTTDSSQPTAVVDVSNAVAIAAGGGHTCTLLMEGSIQCWGGNAYGELGVGTFDDSSVPVTVGGF